MLPTIKAEFRKLLTIRSTYILVALSLILIVIFAFYFEGYRGNTGSPASTLQPTALKEIIANGIGLGIMFASIIAILFMAHEYRYNTIMYTLTANARRTQVLLSKIFTAAVFGVTYGLLMTLFALGCYLLGLSLRDASLPPQDISWLAEFGKVVFYSVGYILFGLLIATATRSVIAGIATLFIFPTTVEPLLGLILKDNTKYLPFTALDSTTGAAIAQSTLSPGNAIIVSTIYLVAGILITWFLFVKRDAS